MNVAWQPWKLQLWMVVLVPLKEIRNLFIPRTNGDGDSESDAVPLERNLPADAGST